MERSKPEYANSDLLNFLTDTQLEDTITSVIRCEDDNSLLYQLEDHNPDLYKFVQKMNEFRHGGGISQVENSPYIMGASMMEKAIRENYTAKGQPLPRISKPTTDAYLKDLIGGEDTHYEVKVLSGAGKKVFNPPERLTLDQLQQKMYANNLDPEQHTALILLLQNIMTRSGMYTVQVVNEQKGFFSALDKNVNGSKVLNVPGRTNVNFMDFCHGAIDIYIPFKILEETNRIRKMYNAPVK